MKLYNTMYFYYLSTKNRFNKVIIITYTLDKIMNKKKISFL